MTFRTNSGSVFQRGFTLVELLVVMAIIATLLSIAAPRYLRSVDDAKEAALRSNLSQLREAIDQFHADRGIYPQTLSDLVEKRYLRSIPIDPIAESNTVWVLSPPPGSESLGAVYDVHSGATGLSRLGEPYGNW